MEGWDVVEKAALGEAMGRVKDSGASSWLSYLSLYNSTHYESSCILFLLLYISKLIVYLIAHVQELG